VFALFIIIKGHEIKDGGLNKARNLSRSKYMILFIDENQTDNKCRPRKKM
jgi:hypothetical protein